MRALTLARPLEVRTVPTCSDISENAHLLLQHLTRTARVRKGARVVRTSLDDWATSPDLALNREAARLAYEEIAPEGEEPGSNGMLSREPKTGRLLVRLPCTCKRTDSSIPPSSQGTGTRKVGRRAPTGSASRLLTASPCQEEVVSESPYPPTEGGEEEALARFLNGSSAGDPTPSAAPGKDSVPALVDHFVERVCVLASRQGFRVSPLGIRRAALGAHFKDLLAWGTPASEIRSAIDDFASDYRRYHKPGVDPARVFLAHRRRLLASQEERATFVTERDIDKFRAEAKAKGRRYSTIDDIIGRTS